MYNPLVPHSFKQSRIPYSPPECPQKHARDPFPVNERRKEPPCSSKPCSTQHTNRPNMPKVEEALPELLSECGENACKQTKAHRTAKSPQRYPCNPFPMNPS